MNTLDMYTREKANKAHLEDLYREARNLRGPREVEREGDSEDIPVNRRKRASLPERIFFMVKAALRLYRPRKRSQSNA